jgi:hypothetical protein
MNFDSGLLKAIVERPDLLAGLQERMEAHAGAALKALQVGVSASLLSREGGEGFLKVVGQSRGFAHRLGAHDFLPIAHLARDYGVDPETIADLRPNVSSAGEADADETLHGKTVGIYTLTETAGARAKAALKELFPGCNVEVNSDKVCTASLTNLAKTADIFVFAWRSSSHQAFFCVKDALDGRNPVYAAGKGTASLVNAVRAAAQ